MSLPKHKCKFIAAWCSNIGYPHSFFCIWHYSLIQLGVVGSLWTLLTRLIPANLAEFMNHFQFPPFLCIKGQLCYQCKSSRLIFHIHLDSLDLLLLFSNIIYDFNTKSFTPKKVKRSEHIKLSADFLAVLLIKNHSWCK